MNSAKRFKIICRFTTLSLLCLASSSLFAVNVYQCEDELGNKSFQAHCPPGTEIVDKKQYGSKPKQAVITPTVYLISNCPACSAVQEFFQSRQISITEINIENNTELQAELIGIVGSLKVPTIIIGEKILSDYRPDELVDVLTQAGFSGISN